MQYACTSSANDATCPKKPTVQVLAEKTASHVPQERSGGGPAKLGYRGGHIFKENQPLVPAVGNHSDKGNLVGAHQVECVDSRYFGIDPGKLTSRIRCYRLVLVPPLDRREEILPDDRPDELSSVVGYRPRR